MTDDTHDDVLLTLKQQFVMWLIFEKEFRFILFGGAIRGAKTFGILILATLLCKFFKGSRWAIVRKDLPTIKSNVIPSYRKVQELFPGFLGDVNFSSPVTATCSNGSEIIFWPESFDTDKQLDRFKGLEVNGFLPDEMNELQEVTFDKMMERAGTHIISPMPPAIVVGTCNPNKMWPKRVFYDPWSQYKLRWPYAYIPAGPMDNPFLPPEFLQNLMALKERNPIHYAKFVLGDWEVSEGDTFHIDDFTMKTRRLDTDEWYVEMFGDLAYTKKTTSDDCSFALCGISHVADRHVFENTIRKMDERDSMDWIFRKQREFLQRGFDPIWRLEAHSSYLFALDERMKLENLYFQVIPLKPGGVSKVDRILNRRTWLRFWTYDPSCQQLINQHIDWSPELIDVLPDDGLDMMSYADTELVYGEGKVTEHKPVPKDPIMRDLHNVMEGLERNYEQGMR